MMRIIDIVSALGSRVYTYSAAVLLIFIPLLVLCALGLTLLWERGWVLGFLIFSGISVLPLWLLRPKKKARVEPKSDGSGDVYLDSKREWSAFDKRVWQEEAALIDERAASVTSLEELQLVSMEQWKSVSARYSNEDSLLNFTLPEALLVTEVLSREYRRLLVLHFPAARQVTIGKARRLYDSGSRWYGRYTHAYNGWRVIRTILNPAGSFASELRGQAMDALLEDLSASTRQGLKRILLEELTQVAIDLYSGRLKVSDEELVAHTKAASTSALAPALPPLRVALIGQVNAGKSTLLNTLIDKTAAPVDVLPCSAGPGTFRLSINGEVELELVDTTGLDGTDQTLQENLAVAAGADIVLLLSAANQPAKAADLEFVNAWRTYFDQHLERLMPQLIIVSTHNDMLKPKSEWQPPYDIAACRTEKSRHIRDALDYVRETLAVSDDTPAVPIALSSKTPPYNIDVLITLLLQCVESAHSVQLNRLRSEANLINRASAKSILNGALTAGRWVGKPATSQYLRRWKRDPEVKRPA